MGIKRDRQTEHILHPSPDLHGLEGVALPGKSVLPLLAEWQQWWQADLAMPWVTPYCIGHTLVPLIMIPADATTGIATESIRTRISRKIFAMLHSIPQSKTGALPDIG